MTVPAANIASVAVDTHTHSVASGHAYCTVREMAKSARKQGLAGFALTDHSPGMPGGAHLYHFYNLRVLPREIEGVIVLHGAETNIMNFEGRIDLPEDVLKLLDVVIASFHIPTCPPGTADEHTEALIKVMDNPYVKIIGHPDDSRYPYDIPAVVRKAGETKTLLEMNNTSLSPRGFRVGAGENYRNILDECRRQDVKITLASDAHYADHVGEVDLCMKLIKEIGFPEELIANSSIHKLAESLEISI